MKTSKNKASLRAISYSDEFGTTKYVAGDRREVIVAGADATN